MLVNIHTHRPRPDEVTIRTLGIHPWHAGGADDAALAEVETAAAAGRIDAVGETGLDFACDVDRQVQERIFSRQLETAERHSLPVVIHCVRAFEPLMKIMAEYRLPAAIFHGFTGSAEQMRRAVRSGGYISYGERTFASPRTLAAMRETPAGRLFFETDDSGTAIEEIYARAAEVLGTDVAVLDDITKENYERIFANGGR